MSATTPDGQIDRTNEEKMMENWILGRPIEISEPRDLDVLQAMLYKGIPQEALLHSVDHDGAPDYQLGKALKLEIPKSMLDPANQTDEKIVLNFYPMAVMNNEIRPVSEIIDALYINLIEEMQGQLCFVYAFRPKDSNTGFPHLLNLVTQAKKGMLDRLNPDSINSKVFGIGKDQWGVPVVTSILKMLAPILNRAGNLNYFTLNEEAKSELIDPHSLIAVLYQLKDIIKPIPHLNEEQ